MHSLNHLACRGSVWEQQANSNDAGDWESLPPNFMHNKWEITCFLPAEILNGKRVSLGGDEESFPSLSIFSPSTAWDSGSSQGTGIGAAIQPRVCSCSAGLLIHLHSRQQQANLNQQTWQSSPSFGAIVSPVWCQNGVLALVTPPCPLYRGTVRRNTLELLHLLLSRTKKKFLVQLYFVTTKLSQEEPRVFLQVLVHWVCPTISSEIFFSSFLVVCLLGSQMEVMC